MWGFSLILISLLLFSFGNFSFVYLVSNSLFIFFKYLFQVSTRSPASLLRFCPTVTQQKNLVTYFSFDLFST